MRSRNSIIIALVMALQLCGAGLRAQLAVLPMEFSGKHMYVRVGTASSDTLRFIFDTGSTGTLIDSAVAEKIGVSRENRQVVGVAGVAGSSRNVLVPGQRLRLGSVSFDGVNLVLSDLGSLSADLGGRLDGLIGYEVLSRYVTRLDFDDKQISLYGGIDQVDTTGYTSIPFEFNRNVLIPRFPITVGLFNGEKVTGRVMFDTGNAFALLVSTPFNKFHQLEAKVGQTFDAWGLNPNAPDKVGALRSMSFNGFKLGKMGIRLTVNEKAVATDGYLGILGIEVIKRFNVILDYAHKKIYLRPNSHFKDPFAFEQEDPRAKQGRVFLEGNAHRTGVVVTPSGMQYQVISQGTGPVPVASDKVSLRFSASLSDGTKLWSTLDEKTQQHKPWQHHLDRIEPGVKQALLLMPAGSKWRVYVPSGLAYGGSGYGKVPPHAVLVYELELLEVLKDPQP